MCEEFTCFVPFFEIILQHPPQDTLPWLSRSCQGRPFLRNSFGTLEAAYLQRFRFHCFGKCRFSWGYGSGTEPCCHFIIQILLPSFFRCDILLNGKDLISKSFNLLV